MVRWAGIWQRNCRIVSASTHGSCQDLPRDTMLINYNGGAFVSTPGIDRSRHAQPHPVRVDSLKVTSNQLVDALKPSVSCREIWRISEAAVALNYPPESSTFKCAKSEINLHACVSKHFYTARLRPKRPTAQDRMDSSRYKYRVGWVRINKILPINTHSNVQSLSASTNTAHGQASLFFSF
jgi:hypothetical protein